MISLTLLGWLLYWVDAPQLLAVISTLKPRYIILGCGLQLLTIAMINYQWHQIARRQGLKIKFFQLLHINLVGTFWETITPAVKAGGEAAKIYLLSSRPGVGLGRATALTLIQKTFSLSAFLLVNLAGLIYWRLQADLSPQYMSAMTAGIMVLLLMVLLLAGVVFFPASARILPGKYGRSDKVSGFWAEIQLARKSTRFQPGFVLRQFLWSVLIWVLFALKAYLLAWALDIDVGLIAAAVLTCFTYMAGLLPLLPGGLGTFEGTMMLLGMSLGIAAPLGLAWALALRLVTFWFVFLLSALYLALSQVYTIFIRANRPADRKAALSPHEPQILL